MTEQEAIDVLTDDKLVLGTERCMDDSYGKLQPAMDLAIEALGKQIPKKPIVVECIHPEWNACDRDGVDCENLSDCRYRDCLCPNCEESLRYVHLTNPRYCPVCGQKLDWEKTI